MTIWKKIALAALVAVVCGCEKEQKPADEKPAVPRSQDAAYTNALKQVQVKRKVIASRRRVIVEQMETTYNSRNGVRASRQNIFQPAMSATSKQEPVHIQSQFMAEIILNVLPLRILD